MNSPRAGEVEEIRAEMVAQVHSVLVGAGAVVVATDTVMVLESMKMEIPVAAGATGRVTEVAVSVGDVVHEGDLLAVVRHEDVVTGPVSITRVVTDDDTAQALGSGTVPVLATPRVLAWLEAATVAAAGDLGEGRTSVGTRVELDHRAATPVGAEVRLTARVAHRDGRRVDFEAIAEHDLGDGPVVAAHARITRIVVDLDRFLGR